ncbi:transmembrane protein 132C [Amia ocellicauda]|uniref:transmembrane protein 132C n=1 Tax=Amia ocellicauda TaxID=2972642 RepID=UPI003463DBB1
MFKVISDGEEALSAHLPPLSLPAQLSVSGSWAALPLSQAQQDLFANSSLLAHSLPLLLLPRPGAPGLPAVQASFGPYTVTQEYSGPLLPLSPSLSASLVSARSRVRVLFHWRGGDSRGRCVTLHAFKETQELRATCLTEAPLGVCVVSLSLPETWLSPWDPPMPRQTLRHTHRRAHRHAGKHTAWLRKNSPGKSPGTLGAQVQLYYSTSGSPAVSPTCQEDKLQESQNRLYYIGAVNLGEAGREGQRKDNLVGMHTPSASSSSSFCSGTQRDARHRTQEGEELWLDPNVLIGYCKGPVKAGQPIVVSVLLRSNFSADVVVIRLKVKKGTLTILADSAVTSGPWAVGVERSVGAKHETMSLICHRINSLSQTDSLSLYQEVACLSVQSGGAPLLRGALSRRVLWGVEYSGRNNPLPPLGGIVSTFTFTHTDIVGIAPIPETTSLINTAVLTGQPVSLPVTVLAVEHDGKVSDVTSAAICRSTNKNIIKVSSDCSALFVDGSESGPGGVCVEVEFSLGALSGSLCLTVWAPQLPLSVSLSDSQLNLIQDWRADTGRGCSPVFQRSSVQVLAQFTALAPLRGRSRLIYMLGSPDWSVDVTALVRDWLRVEDPRVAHLDERGILIGLEPGMTSLQVVSTQWDSVLGAVEVTVSPDPVTLDDLWVQLVTGLSLSITASPSHPAVVTATVTAQHILHSYGEEGSLSVWLQFSDASASPLATFDPALYSLRLTSAADSVVTVATLSLSDQPRPLPKAVARGDGGGPLLRAELVSVPCRSSQPMGSEGDVALAGGSGWVRVKLQPASRAVGSEEAESELLEISEFLLESDSENSFQDNDSHSGGREREESAVVRPSLHDHGLFVVPPPDSDLNRERGNEGESVREGERDGELEVGVAALLSLLCLSSVLFLINCLPCALREREMKRREGEGDGESGGDGESDGDGVDDDRLPSAQDCVEGMYFQKEG